MAENQGVETPTPAQSEDGANSTQATNPFEDPRVKQRLGEISAAKRAAEERAIQEAQYRANLEAELAKARAPGSHDSGDPDDPDAEWSRKYLLDPLDKRLQEVTRDVDTKVAQLADRFEKEDFWKEYPGDSVDLKGEVESLVTQMQASGQPVNRQFARYLILGKRTDEARSAETEAAHLNERATQTVNEKAKVATGSTPVPEPGKSFDDLSPDEKFKALSQGGAFDAIFGSR